MDFRSNHDVDPAAQAWMNDVMKPEQWHHFGILHDGDTTRVYVLNLATGAGREKAFSPGIDRQALTDTVDQMLTLVADEAIKGQRD